MSFPSDLAVLPTAPWDERPTELPLDVEECRTALWKSRGNVTNAAALLKVQPSRLRAFVGKSEYLKREMDEAREMILDIAEENVYDALTDENDPGRRDSMTRFILPQLGAARGFGTKSGLNISVPGGGKGRLMVAWDDGEVVAGGKVIDGEVNDN